MMIYQNEYTLTVDIKKKGINQIPVFVKNDTAILNLRFLDDDMEYDISTADRYTVSFKKPSGAKVTGRGRYENGMMVYELGATEMEEIGMLEVIAQVYIGTTRISTRPFQVKILEDIENGIASQEQLTLLQELFIEVDNHGNYAKSQGDYAKQKGDNLGHKGVYSATVAYKNGNVVTYGGVNYICIKDTTAGIDPTNGTYWTSISPQASINEQSWTATEGQTVFTITNGKYVLGKGNIEVWVGGVLQIKEQGYTETSETTFTLTSGVTAGTIVYAKWFEGHMTITKGHMKSHELGGQDELDITKLKNYNVISEQLAERPTKEEVRKETTTNPIVLSELHTEVKQAMTGGSVAVVGQNSVGIENIKRKSVTESRTSFLKNKGNLFNKNDILLDGYFLSTGAWSTDTAFNSANYIEVDYGSTYITNVSNRIYSHVVFFDINKNFVSSIPVGTWSGTINVPNDPRIYYMTFAFYKTENTDILMLVKGSSLPATYIPYGFTLNEYFSLTNAQLNPLLEVKTGKNLFNYSTMVKVGKEIGTNAVERDGANSALMDYVPIDDTNKKLNISGLTKYATGYNRLYSFYDANKTPLVSNIGSQYILNSVTEGTINIPTGAKYFRMNIYSNKTSGETFDFSKIQVEYGVVTTRLEPYQTYVDKVNGIKTNNKKLKTNDLRLLLFGDSITETATLSDDGSTYTEGTRENWATYTQSILKFKEMWNYAKSGASYKDRVIGTGADTITSIRQRVTHQVQTAINNNRPGDVIIFAAGTNDGNTNMGSYSTAMSKATLADLDKTLLYEAMRWCFWTIQTYYPDALKFVSLPIQRGSYEPIESLNKAIREMGERYGFIVINMTAESQIVRDFETSTSQRDLPDLLHPSKSGQIKMAKVFNRHILNNLNDGF